MTFPDPDESDGDPGEYWVHWVGIRIPVGFLLVMAAIALFLFLG